MNSSERFAKDSSLTASLVFIFQSGINIKKLNYSPSPDVTIDAGVQYIKIICFGFFCLSHVNTVYYHAPLMINKFYFCMLYKCYKCLDLQLFVI